MFKLTAKQTLRYSFLIFLSVFVLRCGGNSGGNTNPANPPRTPNPSPQVGSGDHVQLFLFSAPWCAECNRDLPEIKKRYLNDLSADQQARTDVTVNVVTGKTPGQVATQDVAEKYGRDMGLPFKMMADKNYKIYRTYFEEGNAIPAAVVLDKNTAVIKKYEPGSVDLDDMFNTLKANLK